jgi:hypothetical protein
LALDDHNSDAHSTAHPQSKIPSVRHCGPPPSTSRRPPSPRRRPLLRPATRRQFQALAPPRHDRGRLNGITRPIKVKASTDRDTPQDLHKQQPLCARAVWRPVEWRESPDERVWAKPPVNTCADRDSSSNFQATYLNFTQCRRSLHHILTSSGKSMENRLCIQLLGLRNE